MPISLADTGDLVPYLPGWQRTEPSSEPGILDLDVVVADAPAAILHADEEADTLVPASRSPGPITHDGWVNTAIQSADVMGRIIAVEQSHMEPPAFDPVRAFTRFLWGLLFLAAPLVLLSQVFLVCGPLPVVAMMAGLLFLGRCVSLTNLLCLMHLFGTRSHVPEQVPVWYARVRSLEDESEVMVRLKGSYVSGNVSGDDMVAFWGNWRQGVLMAKRGFNCRTRSEITFRRSKWRIYLVLTLVFMAVLAMQFHTTWSNFVAEAMRQGTR